MSSQELNVDQGHDLLDRYAKKLVQWKMGTIAILFLDSMKPLSFIGSQLLHVFNPVLTIFPQFKNMDKIATLLEERENLEFFIERIENHLNSEGNS